mmetsp:Transcript_11225/g.19196  ORF Transcript_11225/g.19196 Transcript_11225/m.19196 type:complete len:375 (-) Transcript_11225:244-1368(-)
MGGPADAGRSTKQHRPRRGGGARARAQAPGGQQQWAARAGKDAARFHRVVPDVDRLLAAEQGGADRLEVPVRILCRAAARRRALDLLALDATADVWPLEAPIRADSHATEHEPRRAEEGGGGGELAGAGARALDRCAGVRHGRLHQRRQDARAALHVLLLVRLPPAGLPPAGLPLAAAGDRGRRCRLGQRDWILHHLARHRPGLQRLLRPPRHHREADDGRRRAGHQPQRAEPVRRAHAARARRHPSRRAAGRGQGPGGWHTRHHRRGGRAQVRQDAAGGGALTLRVQRVRLPCPLFHPPRLARRREHDQARRRDRALRHLLSQPAHCHRRLGLRRRRGGRLPLFARQGRGGQAGGGQGQVRPPRNVRGRGRWL